jgi:hypothetical protein
MQSLPWTFKQRFISTLPKLNIPNDCSREMKEKIEKIQQERTQNYLYKIWETMTEEQKLWWIMK